MSASKPTIQAGNFCWFELMTSDSAAAKTFYSGLFGWEANDVPAGPEMIYTIFRLDGGDVSATYTMKEEQKSMGIPPHWMLYILTENVDESAAKASDLGGTVLMSPFDVMDQGRMSIVQDPTGATFALWQSKGHTGAVTGKTNTFGWGELATTDTSKAGEFYTSLLGWTKKESEMPGMVYTEFQLNGNSIGGMMNLMDQTGQVPPHWLLYYMVDDCDKTAEKATSTGASLLVPPMDIPNVGRFSVIRDPQGAVFAIIALGPRG